MNTNDYIAYDQSKLTDCSYDMIIPNGYYNKNNITTFNISNTSELNRIEIGDNCFGNVRVFSLIGLIG